MSVKISARLNDDLYNKIMLFKGKNFTEKLENALFDIEKEVSDKNDVNEVSDMENEVSDTVNYTLDSEKAKFLIAFIHLYEGNFTKWWTINEDIDNKVINFIRGILLDLGDSSFPVSDFYNTFSDIKDLIKKEYSYFNF